MRRSAIVLTAVLAAAVLGCLGSPSAGPDATVRRLLDGARAGDLDAFLECCDLRALYEGVVAPDRRQGLPFEQFVEETRRGLAGKLKPNAELEYEVQQVDQHGPEAVVQIRLRANANAEWVNWKLELLRTGRAWKVTAHGIEALAQQAAPS